MMIIFGDCGASFTSWLEPHEKKEVMPMKKINATTKNLMVYICYIIIPDI